MPARAPGVVDVVRDEPAAVEQKRGAPNEAVEISSTISENIAKEGKTRWH